MKRSPAALGLALLLASCGSGPARPQDPPSGATVTLRGKSFDVTHFVKDPERRYAPDQAPKVDGGHWVLCSWDRDRIVHLFSTRRDQGYCVAFLDAEGKVVEQALLPEACEEGETSKISVRHALLLSPGWAKGGIKVGDVIGFSAAVAAAKVDPLPVIKVADTPVHVEPSHLLSQRMRGLMHRPRLSKDEGMLFLYPQAEERSFWMKNTLIPLDIAYFDAEGNLLNVRRMKPAADPAKGGELKAPSAGPARFVLEVNYGWFDARSLIDAEGKPVKPVKLEIPDHLRRLADQAE